MVEKEKRYTQVIGLADVIHLRVSPKNTAIANCPNKHYSLDGTVLIGDAEMICKDPLCAKEEKIPIFESQTNAKLFICFYLYLVAK